MLLDVSIHRFFVRNLRSSYEQQCACQASGRVTLANRVSLSTILATRVGRPDCAKALCPETQPRLAARLHSPRSKMTFSAIAARQTAQ